MNKVEMIEKIAEKTGLSKKDSTTALNAMVETITEVLVSGDKLTLPGLGTFVVKERAARVGRNPRTKEEIQIPASKVPTLKFSSTIKKAL